MGWDFGSIVSAIATGGLSEAVKAVDSSGKTESILSGGVSDVVAGKPLGAGTAEALNDTIGPGLTSALTGGLSDLAQASLPYSGFARMVGPETTGVLTAGVSDQLNGNASNQAMNDWMVKQGIVSSDTGAFLNTSNSVMDSANTLTVADWIKGADKGTETGDVWAGLDRSIDPGGAIDSSNRDTGDKIESGIPGSTQYAPAVGTTVGALVGNAIPVIGTGVGAAIGSGIGNKIASGNRNYDYGGNFASSGASYVGASAGAEAGGVVSGAVGGTTGAVLGGATTGAVTGAAGQVPNAVETGDYSGVGQGALYGGAVGGLLTGAGQLYNAGFPNTTTPNTEDLAYQYALDNPGEQVYIESPQQAMSDEAYLYAQNHPGTWVNSETGQLHPTYGVGTPSSMYTLTPSGNIPYAPANPSGMYPLDKYNNIQYAPSAPEVAYPLSSNAERLNAFEMEPQFATDYIHPYELGSGYGADVPVGSTNYDPHNTYFDTTPSFWNTLGDLGKDILRNLPNLLGGGGNTTTNSIPSIPASPSVPSGSSSNPETIIQHAPMGTGKSKGIKAGMVEGDEYTGLDFMPLNDINRYKNKELYYT